MKIKKTIAILLATLTVFGNLFFTNVASAASTSSISIELDKTTANVGDIIKATVKIADIPGFAGYQVNMKYDPTVLQPVYPETGEAYLDSIDSTIPEGNTVLTKTRYTPLPLASHDFSKGILNFANAYMNLPSYKNSGAAETTGILAVIGFKVLKVAPTTISFADADTMPGSKTGTSLFDWDGKTLSDYTVVQPPSINSTVSPSPTSTVKPSPTSTVKPSPTSTVKPSTSPSPTTPVTGSYIKFGVDKTTAQVGDIIIGTVSINEIPGFAGYQVNMKYDPTVLQPVYPDTGEPYLDSIDSTIPEGNTVLTKSRYTPLPLASHDFSKGILNFANAYMNLPSYKNSGAAETTGTLAVIGFKVLKVTPTIVLFTDADTMPGSKTGTSLFDWDGKTLSDYTVVQGPSINGEVSPSPTSTVKPSSTSTVKPSTSPSPTTPVTGSYIKFDVDKTTAQVGDIIKGTVSINEIPGFAGYQVNMKYDPTVLQPVYPDTGEPYLDLIDSTIPEGNDVLTKTRYTPLPLASHDFSKGILNFANAYMNLPSYKNSGAAETTGTLAVIGFKVLKVTPTIILFTDADTMPGAKTGTSLFDWDGKTLSDYTVVQGPSINGTVSPIPTSTVKPSTSPSPTTPVTGSYIKFDVDKTTAQVGDIIKGTVSINEIPGFAGYQVNMKYDPTVLQPVYPDTGEPYLDLIDSTIPEGNDILTKTRYTPLPLASHDFSKGILNFANAYMNLPSYKNSGAAETTGTLAVIGFKVLKVTPTIILFTDADTMPGAKTGTSLFDWDGKTLSNYTVVQGPSINGTVSPSPSSTVKPSTSPSPTIPVTGSYIKFGVDKTTAQVGDIIIGTVSINEIPGFAGYQVNMKYDPTVLQPVYPDTGEPYLDLIDSTIPEGNDILTKTRFTPLPLASHDFSKGILNFANAYMNLPSYKNSGVAETTGTLAVIGFKVLKVTPTIILFTDTSTMPGAKTGTSLFDWDGKTLSDYTVVQGPSINGTVSPSPTSTVKPSATSTSTVRPSPSPTSTPTTIPSNIKVQFCSWNTDTNSNTIYANFKLINTGSSAVDLTQIKLRYYFTMEGTSALNFFCDYVSVGSVAGAYYDISNATNANKYLEVKFNSGSLAANSEVVVQTRTAKSDWSSFNQSNDYSFTATATNYTEWNKITAYQSDKLIFGIEPFATVSPTNTPTSTPTRTVSPTNTPTKAPVTSTPTNTTGPIKGSISASVDKTSVKVGEIVQLTISVDDIDGFAGYQANIKFDPTIFQAVYPDTGEAYVNDSIPEGNTILTKRQYTPLPLAAHDLDNGILNIANAYMNLAAYKAGGNAETSGVLAVIGFKALKTTSTSSILFQDTTTMPGAKTGTLVFNWNDGSLVNNYAVNQAPAIKVIPAGPTPTPGKNRISITVDKPTVKVGDILTATISIEDIAQFAGYQANIKFDPTIFQAVYPDTGEAYVNDSIPEGNTILTKRQYTPLPLAAHDLGKGILNFANAYMNLASYKAGGNAETTGTLAVIGFKALKAVNTTSIFFQDTATMPGAISGTSLFNWDSATITDYSVVSAEGISVVEDMTPTPTQSVSPTPTSTESVSPTPTSTQPTSSTSPTPTSTQPTSPTSPTPTSPSGAKIAMTFDKTTVKVGDILTATISIKDIDNFAGYQANIKFDPTIFQAVYPDTGEAYVNDSIPEGNTILTKRQYTPLPLAVHDLENGILNMANAYMNLASYKAGGNAETTGILAVIGFKALKAADTTSILFQDTTTMPGAKIGTMLFNWDSEYVTNYSVEQGPAIKVTDGTLPTGMWGDVDADGKVTTMDYSIIQRYILKMYGKEGFTRIDENGDEVPYPEGYILGDVDGTFIMTPDAEELLTANDLAWIRRRILKMPDAVQFPVEKLLEQQQ